MKKKNVKIFLFILILLILVFLGNRAYLCIYANQLEKSTAKVLGLNYYVKIIEEDHSNNKKTLQNLWYTEQKQKVQFGDFNTPEVFSSIYHNSERNISTLIPENSNNVSIIVDKASTWFSLYTNAINPEIYLTQFETNDLNSNNSLLFKVQYLWKAFMQVKSIKTKDIDGKECYVVKNSLETIYIEKETNLPIKIDDGTKTYYFEFSVGTVKDEDVKFIDLSKYYVTVNAIIE